MSCVSALNEEEAQSNGHGDLAEAVHVMNLEEEEEENEKTSELRFVPDNRLMRMFSVYVFNYCYLKSLHE